MSQAINNGIFQADLWKTPLEKYATATSLTVQLYNAREQVVLGPIHPTPLFRLFHERGYDPGIFAECAHDCLSQTGKGGVLLDVQNHGLAVVGASLRLGDEIVAAAVAGYALSDFTQVSEVQILARHARIPFSQVWAVARHQQPIPKSRLTVQGELLQALGESLLTDHERTRQYRRLAAIVESSHDAIISYDLNGIITSWNLGAERLFGYTADEAMGQSATMLIPADRIEQERAILGRMRAGDRIEHYETVRVHKNGAMLDVALSLSPLIDGDGRIVGASKIARDISERKRGEAALRESEAQLRESNRLKDEFIATLSHELRTPLVPIKIWTHMLKSGTCADVKTAVETIERNVELQIHLIDDLLDLNRAIRGKIKLEAEPQELSTILRSTLNSVRMDAKKRGIGLKASGLNRSVGVKGDSARLQQIFTNILSNAIKFTPHKGQIQLTLSIQNGSAVVTVSDTGVGIQKDFLPHVFEMFRQQEGSIERSHSGLGIGLALVKKLVDLHRGSIEISSEGRGKGTVVTVRLPCETPLAHSIHSIRDQGRAANISHAAPLAGVSILLVEDSDDTRYAMKVMLERLGAHVRLARNGREALKTIRATSADVVLCDLCMPVMDGFEFLRELRQQRKSTEPPVIAVSGLASKVDQGQTQDAGFHGHLNKPFDEDSLLAAIRRVRPAA